MSPPSGGMGEIYTFYKCRGSCFSFAPIATLLSKQNDITRHSVDSILLDH